jgi:hypothetical protein
MKHVGKMKNNGAKVAVVFRTLPGDPLSALVVGTNALPDAFHDSLMSTIENESTQQANELADILAVRRFPDGSNMLEYLHSKGLLTKVATKMVSMVFDAKNQMPLDELNQLIADQKGVPIEDLSIKEGEPVEETAKESPVATKNKWDKAREDKALAIEAAEQKIEDDARVLTPADMRSRADALYKEAARLRKEADAIDPPKKKTAKAEITEA